MRYIYLLISTNPSTCKTIIDSYDDLPQAKSDAEVFLSQHKENTYEIYKKIFSYKFEVIQKEIVQIKETKVED